MKPDVLIKPVFKGISFRETLKVNNLGMWGGVLYLVTGRSLFLRAEILNVSIGYFNIEYTGLQAYNVQVQVSYVVNAVQNSSVAIMFLIGDLCKDEEDRASFKKVMAQIVKYNIIITAIISVIVFVFANGISVLYLGDTSKAIVESSAGVLRACAVGFLFQMIVLLFVNYIQIFKHYIISSFVIVVCNVIVPLYGAAFGGEYAKMKSTDVVVGMFGGITTCIIILTVMLPILLPFINRRLRGRDLWWMMPEDFGTPPEDELRAVITGENEVMDLSKRAWEFCLEKGESKRIAYLASLAIEEMAMNVVRHGFNKDDKDHVLSVRAVYKADEFILRFRDDCKRFDPRKKYE